MSARQKLVSLAVVIIAGFALVIFLQRQMALRELRALFLEQQEKTAGIFSQMIVLENKRLEAYVMETTYWDELVEATRTHNRAWFLENIQSSLTKTIGYHTVWVFDRDRAPVYAAGDGVEIKSAGDFPVPPSEFGNIFGKGHACHFFVKTSFGVLEITGAFIQPSADEDRKTPPLGYFFAGRLWNQAYRDELSSLVSASVTVLPFIKRETAGLAGFQKRSIDFIRNLPGWEGRPEVSLRVEAPFGVHTIHPLSQETGFYLLLLFTGILISVIMFMFEEDKQARTAAEALRRADERFRQIAAYSDSMVWEIDGQGRYTYVNGLLKDVVGYDPAEIIGKSFDDYFSPEGRQSPLSDLFSRREPFFHQEKQILHKDGSTVIMEITGVPYFGSDGSFRGYRGIARDITRQKKEEEKVNRLAAIVQYSDDAMFTVSLEGIITQWNNGARKIYGFQPEEVIGKSIEVTVPPDRQAEIPLLINRLRHGEHVAHFETIRMRKDGRNFDASLTLSPVLDSAGAVTGISTVARDISRWKKTERLMAEKEKAMRESFEFLRVLIEAIPNPVFYKDTAGVYRGCNKALELFLGKGRAEIIGKTAFDVAPRELAELYQAKDTALISTHPAKQVYEAKVRYADGTSRDVVFYKATYADSNGAAAGVVGVIIDVTEQKRSEVALVQSEARYRALFELAQDAIFLMNDERFIDCNLRALSTFGCVREDMIGQFPFRFSPLIQPDGRNSAESAKEHIKKAYEGVPQHFEWRHCRLDGTEFDTEVSLSRLEIGGQFYLLALVHDLTERKSIERRERLAQLGRIAADIAHEVNNPLMIISGNAQLSLMEEGLSPSVIDSLKIIMEQSLRAKEITLRLLKYARPGKGEAKDTVMNGVVENVVLMIEHPFALKNIKITRSYSNTLPRVTVDEAQMQEVFMNLLTNAKDAMPQGGAISIRTGVDNGMVRIDVIDSGTGMPPAVKERVFDPFFSTKEKGTGLGLAICYGIVKSYRGELKVESELGKGTVFSVFLPIA